MKRGAARVGVYLLCLILGAAAAASADSVTRFQFTQPNFTGGVGNSLFDVAVVEQRGGGEYLKNQGENLELTVQENSLDVERRKVGLENDKVVLERNKVNLEADKVNLESKLQSQQATGTAQSGGASGASSSAAQEPSQDVTNYYVEKWYENTVTGESLKFSIDGEYYQNLQEKNDSKEVTTVDIDNTGNMTYNQDGVTKTIEAGEYNDVDIASDTGYVEQNPTSQQNILIQTGK